MDKKTIWLKVSYRALAGKLVNNIFWLTLGLILVVIFLHQINGIKQDYRKSVCFDRVKNAEISCSTAGYSGGYYPNSERVPTLAEFYGMKWDYHNGEKALFLTIGSALALFSISVSVYCLVFNIFYLSKTKYLVDKQVGKIFVWRPEFPYGDYYREIKFERITEASINQGIFGKLLNTGSIEMQIYTFTNADAKPTEYTIDCIPDPKTAWSDINDGLPDHEGVDVNIHQPAKAPAA